MATIEEPLVPIFMYHRYTVESAASSLGGQDFIYAMRGDGRDAGEVGIGRESAEGAGGAGRDAEARGIDGAASRCWTRFRRGRRGLAVIGSCFRAPRAMAFDPLSPATVAADVTIGFVLQLDRAARMVAQHAVDPALPGLEEVIDRLTKATFDRRWCRRTKPDSARRGARAGGSRDVAGYGVAERAGARHGGVEAIGIGGALKKGHHCERGRPRAERAIGGGYQAISGASGRFGATDSSSACAAGCAYRRRCGVRLAGAGAPVVDALRSLNAR